MNHGLAISTNFKLLCQLSTLKQNYLSKVNPHEVKFATLGLLTRVQLS